jgi:hypothetical protein
MENMHLQQMPPDFNLLDILGISQQEFHWVIDRPDNGCPDVTSDWKYPRHPYRVEEGIVIEIPGLEDSHACTRVAPRDISTGGINVLHHGSLRGGLAVQLEFPSTAGSPISVPGRVVRCFGLLREVYEIGIMFDVPVDIAAILGAVCRRDDQPSLAGVV